MHQFKPSDLVARSCKERLDLPYFRPRDVNLQPVSPSLLGVSRGLEDALCEVVGDLFNRQFVQGDSYMQSW